MDSRSLHVSAQRCPRGTLQGVPLNEDTSAASAKPLIPTNFECKWVSKCKADKFTDQKKKKGVFLILTLLFFIPPQTDNHTGGDLSFQVQPQGSQCHLLLILFIPGLQPCVSFSPFNDFTVVCLRLPFIGSQNVTSNLKS